MRQDGVIPYFVILSQNKVWNMMTVNNNDTWTSHLHRSRVFILNLEQFFLVLQLLTLNRWLLAGTGDMTNKAHPPLKKFFSFNFAVTKICAIRLTEYETRVGCISFQLSPSISTICPSVFSLYKNYFLFIKIRFWHVSKNMFSRGFELINNHLWWKM